RDSLVVSLGDVDRPAQVALPLSALLPEVVAREGMPREELALGGLLEALLGAGVGLHLRHANALLKQKPVSPRRRQPVNRRAETRPPRPRRGPGPLRACASPVQAASSCCGRPAGATARWRRGPGRPRRAASGDAHRAPGGSARGRGT